MMKEQIKQFVAEAVARAQKSGQLAETAMPEIIVSYPKDSIHGDYSSNVGMVLARGLDLPPVDIAKVVVAQILDLKQVKDIFTSIEVVEPGFINFKVSSELLARNVYKILKSGRRYGSSRLGKGKTVVIDYSSPNVAKPMSIGHLRSTVIGQSLVNIFSFLGYKTIADNHLGDWGTQFGKLIYAYKTWGNKRLVKKDPIMELQRLYVRFHDEVKIAPALDDRAREEIDKLQEGDKENTKLWNWFRKVSLNAFADIYDQLGINFDTIHGESFYNDMLARIVDDALVQGIAKMSDGAVIIPFKDDKLTPMLIRKSDGAFLYPTTDLATIKFREEKYQPYKNIYVVGNEQTLHFSQLFEAAELLGLMPKEVNVHVKFGMVSGEGGKRLSTREGRAVLLTDVMEKAIDKARAAVDEREELSDKEKDQVAHIVGLGALKYNDLSQDRLKDISFNWDKLLSFDGNSAPYLQYVAVRIAGILGKAGKAPKVKERDLTVLIHTEEERDLLRKLALFPEVIEASAENYEPHLIANYLFELAQTFNRFYNEIQILQAEEQIRAARLALITAVSHTIENGLDLLGIEVPKRM